MDDGEVDSHSSGRSLLDLHSDPSSHFMDDSSVIQNFEWDTLIGMPICSHKHICNPTTGPDNKHTHTCEHTHTHTIGNGEDEKLTKKRRPAGNKEAVRKYREKQKAAKVTLEVRIAELEKENEKIPEMRNENAKLRKKLQEQGPRQDAVDHLLAENKKLKSLLLNLRRAIDSELETFEEVSYKKLRFTSANVDRIGRTHVPAGGRCAAPLPCFPARPTIHKDTGGSSDDVEHMERSLGWHRECELVKKVTTCHSPEEESEDTFAGQSKPFEPDVGVPFRNAGRASSGSKERPRVCQAKIAAAAAGRRRNINTKQTLKTPVVPLYQQQLSNDPPCSGTLVRPPCFSLGPREAASHPGGVGEAPRGDRWPQDRGTVSAQVDLTGDCSPIATSVSHPEDVIQRASEIGSRPILGSSSSKKLQVEPESSADLFSSGRFYSDDVNQGGSAAHWNPDLFHDVSDDWHLNECDFIDGVCQVHFDAMQMSSFQPCQETDHDSSRSAGTDVT